MLFRAAAWALPAVAVAVATPALAASAEGGDSPLQYNISESNAFGGPNGLLTIHTAMAISRLTQGVPIPEGDTTIVYSLRIANESDEVVVNEEDLMSFAQGEYATSRKHQDINGLPGGLYSVTWQVLSAVDSDNRVVQPSDPDGWTKRMETTVQT